MTSTFSPLAAAIPAIVSAVPGGTVLLTMMISPGEADRKTERVALKTKLVSALPLGVGGV